MKQQLELPLYFLICGIFLFLGCQNEEIPVSETRQQDVRKVTTVSFATFKRLTGLTDFKTTFELPTDSKNLVARRSGDSYSPDDFIIDTDRITQTVVDGKTSYSFPITPKEGEKEDSRYYLAVYDKAGNWLDMVIQSDFSKDTAGNPKETGFKEIYASASRGTGCTTIFTWVINCNGRGQCADGTCDLCSQCLKASSERICGKDEEGYNDGGFTKPGQPDNGGGGNPNPDPDPEEEVIITLPDPNSPDSPCKQLQNLLIPDPQNKKLVPNIRPQIRWLQGKVDEKVEYGVEIKKVINVNDDMVYTPTQVESESSSEVILYVGRLIMGWLHSHPKTGYGMFSFADVKFLKEGYEATLEENRAEVFTMIVCRDKIDPTKTNTYALKIDDIAALSAKIDAVWNAQEYSGMNDDEKLERIHRKQSIDYHYYTDELEFSFLMQFANSGLSLYKADEQLTSWTKLELETDNGYNPPFKVKQKPCN